MQRALYLFGTYGIALGALCAQAPTDIDAARENTIRCGRLLSTAQYCLKYGEYSAAERILADLQTAWPNNPTAHRLAGKLYLLTGRHKDAIQSLMRAGQLDPADSSTPFILALVYATSEPPDMEAARANYKRALKLGAEDNFLLEALLQ